MGLKSLSFRDSLMKIMNKTEITDWSYFDEYWDSIKDKHGRALYYCYTLSKKRLIIWKDKYISVEFYLYENEKYNTININIHEEHLQTDADFIKKEIKKVFDDNILVRIINMW